ncbi:histidine phosphatase family protein [Candidatus Beckwithbacteria bacterium]|nr:histidine phosphatase family protein [Candidatus Beckwithbacteria bacterium]
MAKIYFLTHPEVIIDSHIPIPDWDILDEGKKRVELFCQNDFLKEINFIYSSCEVKAKTTAQIIASVLNLEIKYLQDLGEIDRSATGYLVPEQFQTTVKQFFDRPNQSILGWERAIDAQARIVKAVKQITQKHPDQNMLISSHGGVGALLKCFIKNISITQTEDQKSLGSYFVFDTKTWQLILDWQKI